MRNLLALLGAAIVTFLVVGYFLDWYHIQAIPGSDGHRQVNIDVNTPKIATDLKKGEDTVEHIIEKNQNGTPSQQPPAPNAAPTPSAPNAVTVRPNGQTEYVPSSDGSGWKLP